MSITPAVRNPYCAGSVPSSRVRLRQIRFRGPSSRPTRRPELDAVDAILDVCVFVADVKVGVADRRVVGDARYLQQHLSSGVFLPAAALGGLPGPRCNRWLPAWQQILSRALSSSYSFPERVIDPLRTDHDGVELTRTSVPAAEMSSQTMTRQALRPPRPPPNHRSREPQGARSGSEAFEPWQRIVGSLGRISF